MKTYKINRDPENKPTEEEVLSRRDFHKVSSAYQRMTRRPRKPLYKKPKAFAILIIIALIAWLLASRA